MRLSFAAMPSFSLPLKAANQAVIAPSWAAAPSASYSAFRRIDLCRLVAISLAVSEGVFAFLMFSRLLTASGGLQIGLQSGHRQPWPLLPLSIAALQLNLVCFMGGYGAASVGRGVKGAAAPAQSWLMLAVAVVLLCPYGAAMPGWLGLWSLVSLGGLGLLRHCAASIRRELARSGALARTVAVVDLSGTGADLARRLQLSAGGQLRLLGVFLPGAGTEEKPGLDDLIGLGRAFHLHDVIIAGGPSAAIDAESPLRRRLCELQARVLLHPMGPDAQAAGSVSVAYGCGMVELQCPPLNYLDRVMKRLFDIVVATLLLVLLSPLLAVIAIGVRCSGRGPIIFTQRRYGFNNETIFVHKFRTMRHAPVPTSNVVQATRADPRITPLGHLLRRSSMDELPQLYDVVVGKMSLVGPRPHAVSHNEHYGRLIDDYLGRHRVQPGITGWAQIHGYRGQTDTLEKMERRIEYDLAYIASWSIWLDLRILLLTPIKGLFHPNAY